MYIQTEGYLELVKQQGMCCVTALPLGETAHLWVVPLPVPAEWAFPVWNGYSLSTTAKALAFVSQEAVDAAVDGRLKVVNAIEVSGTDLIYHPVNIETVLKDAAIPT